LGGLSSTGLWWSKSNRLHISVPTNKEKKKKKEMQVINLVNGEKN
jgi:hypothetical protein